MSAADAPPAAPSAAPKAPPKDHPLPIGPLQTLLRLHTPRGWIALVVATIMLLALPPVLNGAVPASSPLHLPDHFVPLLGKFVCYAIVALAMDLIWGYAGILSLGHGLFFALGGY
ncbi:MAG TPA: hypothetical protein VGF45_12720, partial [Polyangia bacterium]